MLKFTSVLLVFLFFIECKKSNSAPIVDYPFPYGSWHVSYSTMYEATDNGNMVEYDNPFAAQVIIMDLDSLGSFNLIGDYDSVFPTAGHWSLNAKQDTLVLQCDSLCSLTGGSNNVWQIFNHNNDDQFDGYVTENLWIRNRNYLPDSTYRTWEICMSRGVVGE